MLSERLRANGSGLTKVKVDTQIEFDNACSERSTLVQVLAQDRPGLLHEISGCFSREHCNIEIALIDTEGQMAIDVFYLTANGVKLTEQHRIRLQRSLAEALNPAA
jgi:[protein-PII] uridylyltransferase